MKIQFRTSTMMLAVAVGAITIGGACLLNQIERQYDFGFVNLWWRYETVFDVSPLWIPFLFVAFALGRNRLTGTIVAVFAIAEAASLALVCLRRLNQHL